MDIESDITVLLSGLEQRQSSCHILVLNARGRTVCNQSRIAELESHMYQKVILERLSNLSFWVSVSETRECVD